MHVSTHSHRLPRLVDDDCESCAYIKIFAGIKKIVAVVLRMMALSVLKGVAETLRGAPSHATLLWRHPCPWPTII